MSIRELQRNAVVPVLAVLVLAVLTGCSNGNGNGESASTTSSTENAGRRVHDGSFRPALELAEMTGCDGAEPLADPPLTPGEPSPVEAVACGGEASAFTLYTYATDADLEEALAVQDSFCGYRAIGERWMVVVNAPETAQQIADALGGESIELSGCGG